MKCALVGPGSRETVLPWERWHTGKQGEMGDKPKFLKRLSSLLMSLKLYRNNSYEGCVLSCWVFLFF